jgi:hypothetical protein
LFLLNCCSPERSVDVIAAKHAATLRKHFKGEHTEDVSTLIARTRYISAKLKRIGMSEQANKFDSYTDVLMYGNQTIDESLHDVMELVKHRNCVCPTLKSLKTQLFNTL